MTVVLRHNASLALNLVEYHGSVTLAELQALAASSQEQHKAHLANDALSIALPDADFYSVNLAELDALFAHYRTLFAPLHLQIYRRSAWICRSAAAMPYVQHWLNGRDMRQDMLSDVRLFETFAEAGDWLVLSDAELASVESGEGFVELARYHTPPELLRSATR